MLLQTQKMPEENYINESHNALLRLKLKKVNKNIETIEKEIKEWNDDQQDQSEYILQIKILQELLKERNIMAAELGTVIF